MPADCCCALFGAGRLTAGSPDLGHPSTKSLAALREGAPTKVTVVGSESRLSPTAKVEPLPTGGGFGLAAALCRSARSRDSRPQDKLLLVKARASPAQELVQAHPARPAVQQLAQNRASDSGLFTGFVPVCRPSARLYSSKERLEEDPERDPLWDNSRVSYPTHRNCISKHRSVGQLLWCRVCVTSCTN